MRHKFAGALFLVVILSAGMFAGCARSGNSAAASAESAAEKTATDSEMAKDTENKSNSSGEKTAGAPPVAMETSDSTTPSGMKVETKICQYKVIRGVNLRSDSNKDSDLVGSLFTGDVIQGTGVCENGWYQLQYDGVSCYATSSCFEETDSAVNVSGSLEPAETEFPDASPQIEAVQAAESAFDVTDWAKYTSSNWESDAATSCTVRIHSIAGNQTILSFKVIDGSLSEKDNSGALIAEVNNCYGKIENGVMNFGFTDSYGNTGVGRMEIVDETHLNIATNIVQVSEGAKYSAAIMTELTEVE